MSDRLCCYKQQQHSKLYWLSLCIKCAPLTDCRISNALIQFVPSCQDIWTQFVDVLDPPFSDIACGIISCLVVGIFLPKNSKVTKFLSFGARGSAGPVVMYHRVLGVQAVQNELIVVGETKKESKLFTTQSPAMSISVVSADVFQLTASTVTFQVLDGVAKVLTCSVGHCVAANFWHRNC